MSFRLPFLNQVNVGVQADPYTVRLHSRAGRTLAKGEVVKLAIGAVASHGELSDNLADGGSDSGLGSVVDLDATQANNSAGIYAVLVDDECLDNAIGTFALSGIVDALVEGTTDVAAGDAVFGDKINSQGALVKVAGSNDGVAILGLALEAFTTDSTNALKKVFFNGFAFNRVGDIS